MTVAALNLIVPSSVTASTGTASISSTGKVTFSGVELLTVNDIFSSTYAYYMILLSWARSTGDGGSEVFLTNSGTIDNTAIYDYQSISANSTTINGSRTSDNTDWDMMTTGSLYHNQDIIYLWNPAASERPLFRDINNSSQNDVRIVDRCGKFDATTTFDGLRISSSAVVPTSGNMLVYGFTT